MEAGDQDEDAKVRIDLILFFCANYCYIWLVCSYWLFKIYQPIRMLKASSNCENTGLFLIYSHLFKQTLQSLQQIYVKNVHPVSGAGIQTHNLQNMRVSSHSH